MQREASGEQLFGEIGGRAEVGLLADLAQHGWTSFRSSASRQEALADVVLQTALFLGQPVPGRGKRLVEVLSPVAHHDAPASSLSSSFGLGSFPFHNDNAHLTVPSRFIVLACSRDGGGGVPTYIADALKSLDTREKMLLAKSAVFHVRSGARSFYATMLDRREYYVRFDPGCMVPQGADAINAMALFSHAQLQGKAIRFDWCVGDVLVMDNRRMLHARGEVRPTALDRTLIRCNVT